MKPARCVIVMFGKDCIWLPVHTAGNENVQLSFSINVGPKHFPPLTAQILSLTVTWLDLFFSLCSDSSLSKMSPCSEAGKPCNPCLDAAKACNLNETCKRLRSAYNSICSKATPPQPSVANQEPCSRKRCQKVGAQISVYVSDVYVLDSRNTFSLRKCWWNTAALLFLQVVLKSFSWTLTVTWCWSPQIRQSSAGF